ncbi:MAG: hypothetical protein KFF77_00600, partial [Bacteroidetes bacterium]|nr:hypothetical protein [Bacteroidota bacterium]
MFRIPFPPHNHRVSAHRYRFFLRRTLRFLRAVALPALLLALLAGCISYEQDTQLDEDGSGSMQIHYWISEDMLTWFKGGNLSFNEDSVRAQYSAEHITVETVRSESRVSDSTRHVFVTLSFDDIRRLPESQGFKDLDIKWMREGDVFRFVQTLPAASSSGDGMLDDFTFIYRFEFPGEVRESNADSLDGSLAIWRYKLSDLSKQNKLEAVIVASSGSNIWWVLGVLGVVLVLT